MTPSTISTQPMRLLPKTHPSLPLFVLGLALLGPAGSSGADDLLVNTFDSDLGPIAWADWRS